MSAPYRIKRTDVGVRKVAATPQEDFNSYLDRLMKMIPIRNEYSAMNYPFNYFLFSRVLLAVLNVLKVKVALICPG